MKPDADHPTTETNQPNLSTDRQAHGDARRPSDRLNKDQPPSTEGADAPVRKRSVL